MATKTSSSTVSTPAVGVVKAPAKAAAVSSTPVRNSAVPKTAGKKQPKEVTYDAIAKRAYEIYLSGTGGSQDDNWARAERELRGI